MERWLLWMAIGAIGALITWQVLTPSQSSNSGRWYSEAQVVTGAPLFQQFCAVCHGIDAASTPHWRTPNEQGHYPPPPLNGSAHTWHHPLNQLRRTIREGGVRLGGQMPPFGNALTAEEIDAILAWIQSNWSDEIYQQWLLRNG